MKTLSDIAVILAIAVIIGCWIAGIIRIVLEVKQVLFGY